MKKRTITLGAEGDITRKVNKQYRNAGKFVQVYIPSECKKWRAVIVGALKKQWGRSPKPKRLHSVQFAVASMRKRPDLDSALHQVVDALSKDAWGIPDSDVRFHHAYKIKSKEPWYVIEATYELEEK